MGKTGILFILPWAEIGGTERHVLTLVKLLSQEYDIRILSPSGPARETLRGAGGILCDEMLPSALTAKNIPSVYRMVKGITGSHGIQAIHIHASRELCLLCRVATPHIPRLFTPHGYIFPGDALTAAQLGSRFSNVTICLSNLEAQNIIGKGACEHKIRVIPNGVEIPREWNSDTPSPKTDGVFTIGCLGRLSPEKGQDLLLHAFHEALPDTVDNGLEYRLAYGGKGPELNVLKTESEKLGIADRVEFSGVVNDPYEWLNRLNLFVLPSRNDSYPLALCEAMACGLPAIATRVGGIPEVIEHGKTGLLAEPTVAGLSEAISRAVSDNALRVSLGRAAREHARLYLDREVMAERTSKLYLELISPT